MRVSSAEMGAYRDALAAEQRAAQEYVERSLRAFSALNPGATVADIREYGIEVLAQAQRMYGDRAAALACVRYDETCRALGLELERAGIVNEFDRDSLESDVRYLAGKVVQGDFEGFVSALGARAFDHALKAANSTVAANAERDRAKGVRWARVPTGRETCGFCLMLASRGFAFRSERSAGGGAGLYNTYHRHCDCVAVPGDASTTVEGYDPDWLYEVYADARSAVEHGARDSWLAAGGKAGTGKAYDKYLRDLICKEISARDREWAWTGKATEAKYTKPRELLEPHERAGIDKLLSHGFAVETIPEDPKAPANLDIILGGKAWEMKNVTNARGSVSNQMKRIRDKWRKLGLSSSVHGVITCEECSSTFEEVCEGVKLRMKPGEVYIVVKDGLMRRIEG